VGGIWVRRRNPAFDTADEVVYNLFPLTMNITRRIPFPRGGISTLINPYSRKIAFVIETFILTTITSECPGRCLSGGFSFSFPLP